MWQRTSLVPGDQSREMKDLLLTKADQVIVQHDEFSQLSEMLSKTAQSSNVAVAEHIVREEDTDALAPKSNTEPT